MDNNWFRRICSLLLCAVLLLSNVPAVSAEGEDIVVVDQATVDQAAADAVGALIAQLPALEEIQAKPMEEQGGDYTQVQSAYSAYEQLTDAQKALLPPAEEVFRPYFDYFNSLTQEAATSGSCGPNATWTYDPVTKTLTISGTGYMYSYENEDEDDEPAPWSAYVGELTTVVIQDGITSIGGYAFESCNSLTSVTMADSVTTIGEYAFWNCNGLTSVTIGEGVTRIMDAAFYDCANLKTVTIPSSVHNIYQLAFWECDSLTDVYYNGTKTQWGWITKGTNNTPLLNATIHYAYRCTSGHSFDDDDICTVCGCVDSTLIDSGKCGSFLTWAVYENGLLNIVGEGSMSDYGDGSISPFDRYSSTITKVKLPDGIDLIGEYAFSNSYPNLAYIEVPLSVRWIRSCAFGATSFNIKLKYPGTMEQWKSIVHSSIASYSRLYGAECSDGTILYMGNCGDDGEYPNVKYTLLGDGTLKLTGSGRMDFYRYLNYSSHFSNDDRIKVVEIEEGIGNIADYAFKNCENLTTIYIPASVTSISYDVFAGCTSLKDVYYGSNEKNWNKVYISDSGNDALANATIHYTDLCVNGHTWLEATCQSPKICEVCDATEGTALDHTYDQEVVEAKYLAAEATCTKQAEYYKSCVCGAKGTETFKHGQLKDHVYDQEKVDAKYLVSEATCTKQAEYKKSCVCGEKGTETFKYGQLKDHVYDQEVADTKYLASEATCTKQAEYYKSCVCGERGTETFKYGELKTHSYSDTVTSPTCTEQGYTTHTCACGDRYVDAYVPALGHDMGAWTVVTEPAPGVAGQERSDCSRCDHYETRQIQYQGNVLKLEGEDFAGQTSVWIDGMPYPIVQSGSDRYVELPTEEDCIIVTYTYHVGDANDVHTQYPTGMKVYKVSGGVMQHIPELDNLLQYSGCSIRITGNKGIRMITSLTKDNKAALTGSGLAGYKLVEYGTMLCWASEIASGDALTLGKPFTRSNYAYRRGVADPVFATSGNLTQYTNVLVGFSNEQCKDDIAMRPYIILEDASGKQITLYGGTISRSIGYIAYQNRNVFQPGTAAYNYVWNIINYVYGTQKFGVGTQVVDGKTMHFSSTGIPFVLVNPWNKIPSDYQVELATVDGYPVATECAQSLRQMLADCKNAGHKANICSAYRSKSTQTYLYNRKVNYYLSSGYSDSEARKLAARSVAVPDTSEHQLGLAVDIVDANYTTLDANQAKTPAQKWLMANCWEYGFILRYPEGTSESTGIIFEPWHYRYVGKEIADEIRRSGLCMEDYLDALNSGKTFY